MMNHIVSVTSLKNHYRSAMRRMSSSIGFIGLGHMGSKMVLNLAKDGKQLVVIDAQPSAAAYVVDAFATQQAESRSSGSVAAAHDYQSLAKDCDIVMSMLPNDAIVSEISQSILAAAATAKKSIAHISCSTISPATARQLEAEHIAAGHQFIAAPVFARPDGIAKRQATWMVSSSSTAGRALATDILSTKGTVVDMGDDVGAANVVKLCGNFLIAASIEAIGESMALAEKNGVDQRHVMNILSSSIFDCLIYKGYGQRVSHRDHRPGGFSLELGLKDVGLVNQTARASDTPMPFLSVLVDRFTSAKARGRSDFDWSAIGLSIAEDAGIDVSADIKRNQDDIKNNNYY